MNFLKQLFTKTPKSKPYNRVDHGGNKYLIPDVLLGSEQKAQVIFSPWDECER